MESENFYILIVVTNVIGLLVTNFMVWQGWKFAVRENKAALRRSQRVQELQSAYETLLQTAIDGGKPFRVLGDGSFFDYSLDLQRAVEIMHLYGDEDQIKLTNRFVKTLSEGKYYAPEDLIESIRNDIRRQMAMTELKSTPTWLNQTVSDTRDEASRATLIRSARKKESRG